MDRIKKVRKGILRWAIMCLLIELLINNEGAAFAADKGQNTTNVENSIIARQIEALDLKVIDSELSKYIDDESKELLQASDPNTILDEFAKGKFGLNMEGVYNNIFRFVLKEIYFNLDIMAKIAVLSVICALLKHLQSEFSRDGVGEIAYYACYTVIITILLASFNVAVKMSTGIIDNLIGFMRAILPVLTALLISDGNIVTGGILHPLMLMATELSATLIRNIFIPLILFSTVITFVGNISDRVQLTKLAELIKQMTVWTLVAVLTVFVALISMQGSLGAVADGITGKAAKFAIGTFIPIVGKTLADAADTVVGCALLIKNAAGIAVALGLALICIAPLLKIAALAALYKATGAILEPISGDKISNCLDNMAGSMLHIFALTASVAFMFIISVTALVSAGNYSAMLR